MHAPTPGTGIALPARASSKSRRCGSPSRTPTHRTGHARRAGRAAWWACSPACAASGLNAEHLENEIALAMEHLRDTMDNLGTTAQDLSTVLAQFRFHHAPRLARAGLHLRWRVEALPTVPWSPRGHLGNAANAARGLCQHPQTRQGTGNHRDSRKPWGHMHHPHQRRPGKALMMPRTGLVEACATCKNAPHTWACSSAYIASPAMAPA